MSKQKEKVSSGEQVSRSAIDQVSDQASDQFSDLCRRRSHIPAIALTPGDHPYVALVREYLSGIGVEAEKVEEESETCINWVYPTPEGALVSFYIYRDPTGEVFLHFETAVSSVDANTELLVLRWISETNASLHFPVRLVLTDDRCIAAQFRCYGDGISAEHCRIRLGTLLPFALEIQDLLSRNFGLLPARKTRYRVEK